MIKNGSLVEAQEALVQNDFEAVLEYTSIAESFGSLTEAETARLHYLKAQAYEKLDQITEARSHYRIVVDRYPGSVYAAAASRRLAQ